LIDGLVFAQVRGRPGKHEKRTGDSPGISAVQSSYNARATTRQAADMAQPRLAIRRQRDREVSCDLLFKTGTGHELPQCKMGMGVVEAVMAPS